MEWNTKEYKQFYESNFPDNVGRLKRMNAACYRNTIKVVTEGRYTTDGGKQVVLQDVERMQQGTRFYCHEFNVEDKPHWLEPPVIEVVNEDCLETACRLAAQDENPLLLNMANPSVPGGAVIRGARAQEETIFRRSNLFQSLYQFTDFAASYGLERRQESYPMDSNWGGIYSPHVTVFRHNNATGYEFMEEPFQMAVVTVAAMIRPRLDAAGHLTSEMDGITRNKIRTIYRIALDNNHTCLVLGAWGCGAFGNPPQEIARLFHEVMEEPEFRDKFTHVVFAIIDDHNAHKAHNSEGNLVPFEREFALPHYPRQQATEAFVNMAVIDFDEDVMEYELAQIPEVGNIALSQQPCRELLRKALVKGNYLHFMHPGKAVIYNIGQDDLQGLINYQAVTTITSIEINRAAQAVTYIEYGRDEELGGGFSHNDIRQAPLPDDLGQLCDLLAARFGIDVPIQDEVHRMQGIIEERSTRIFDMGYKALVLGSIDARVSPRYRWFLRKKLYGPVENL